MMSFIKSKQSSMPDDLKHVNVRNAPTKKRRGNHEECRYFITALIND